MRKETFRSLGCALATVIAMVVHRAEPERVPVMVLTFCAVTVILDYAWRDK